MPQIQLLYNNIPNTVEIIPVNNTSPGISLSNDYIKPLQITINTLNFDTNLQISSFRLESTICHLHSGNHVNNLIFPVIDGNYVNTAPIMLNFDIDSFFPLPLLRFKIYDSYHNQLIDHFTLRMIITIHYKI